MKAHLMYRDRDFDVQMKMLLVSNEEALTQDLALKTLFNAMANGDGFLCGVAREAILTGLQEQPETILYRQAILKDCLRNPLVVRNIYDVAVGAIEAKLKSWYGVFGRSPGGMLFGGIELVRLFLSALTKLKLIVDQHMGEFESEGFRAFFTQLKAELSDEYFASVKTHLEELEFREGVSVSARLGKGNQGSDYILHKSMGREHGWVRRFFTRRPPAYTFHIHPRDEAGARALGDLRDRGIHRVAIALAQSAEHIYSFFVMLRRELAFYLGCVNLHRLLGGKGVPVCFPVPAPPGAHRLSGVGIRDACLALSMDRTVVGNDLAADDKRFCVITGANQGGKTTFLRSVGLAQLMMQCGMFVAAESFSADICRNLFTHYKREEDVDMKSGKLDEELGRMSGIVDALTPDSMLLFNESFAVTNEREGSEIARQIVRALLETRVKVLYVTHLYEFTHVFWEGANENAIFLRAERQADGQRTFKLLPGEPLETSYGADLYEKIFGGSAA